MRYYASRRSISIFTAVAIAAMLVTRGSGIRAQSAQPPAAERRFEVASVKPTLSPFQMGAAAAGGGVASMRFGIQTLPGGRMTATATLKQLIANAFDVRDFQIEGGPAWLTSDYFEITASAGADASPADVRSMLRTLLAERFALRTRTETRQAPVHVLTVGRSDGRLGPGLKRTSPECQQEIDARKNGTGSPPKPPAFNPNSRPTTPVCGMMSMMQTPRAATMLLGGMEIASLVGRISSELAAPVIDKTGLSGLFDITLEYASLRMMGGRAPGLDANSTDPAPLPIDAAVQSQLGLHLQKEIGPLPVVVIEAAERPAPD
jgi:uncharacterized protein (TIGR03435 family)